MRIRLVGVLCLLLAGSTITFAQKHEVSFLSGALKTGDHGFVIPRPGFVRTGTGFSFQAGYAQRFVDAKVAALYLEFPLTVTPRTKIEPSNAVLPRSYSSIFFTPGLKLKLAPGLKWNPYGFAGVGIARLHSSDTDTEGQPTTGDQSTIKGAFDFGGGLDVKVFPHVSFRGEVRDIYTGTPQLSVDLLKDRQHNFMISAGVVVRW
jgi:opacity protein-like surface antigen